MEGLLPRTRADGMLMQGVEDAAVGNEAQEFVGQRASRTNAARLRRLVEAVRPGALFASKAGA